MWCGCDGWAAVQFLKFGKYNFKLHFRIGDYLIVSQWKVFVLSIININEHTAC